MANLDTEKKRRAGLNVGLPWMKVSPSIDNAFDAFDRRHMSFSYGAGAGLISATGFFFDVRIMTRAVAQDNGEASNPSNLGTVHYTYDDMKNNGAKVTLPFG